MNDDINNQRNSVAESFQSVFGNENLLSKVIEFFPYPIQVFAPDGTSVMSRQPPCSPACSRRCRLMVGPSRPMTSLPCHTQNHPLLPTMQKFQVGRSIVCTSWQLTVSLMVSALVALLKLVGIRC